MIACECVHAVSPAYLLLGLWRRNWVYADACTDGCWSGQRPGIHALSTPGCKAGTLLAIQRLEAEIRRSHAESVDAQDRRASNPQPSYSPPPCPFLSLLPTIQSTLPPPSLPHTTTRTLEKGLPGGENTQQGIIRAQAGFSLGSVVRIDGLFLCT